MKFNLLVQANYITTENGIKDRGRYEVRVEDTRPYRYSRDSRFRYGYVFQP